MNISRFVTRVSIASCASFALATACVGSPDGAPVEIDLRVPPAPLEGPLGVNGMSPADFWAPPVQAALRSLGGGALVGADGALVATPLLDAEAGQRILEHAVQCALPEGTTVEPAAGRGLHGRFGLAPAWAARGLDTAEQRWVTACLLQHLNGLGAHVEILLEGSHPALAPRPGQDISGFTVNDVTMFGNVFVWSPVPAFACIDLDLQLTCGLDLSLYSLARLCGLLPTCGVALVGLCDLVCAEGAGGGLTCDLPLGAAHYPEAIRSKVRDTDLLSLYPGCDLL